MLVFRLDYFGHPLVVLGVFRFLLDGHNPQDVATSLGGVDFIGTKQLDLDAGTHFNYRRWKIGIPNIESPGYFLGVRRLLVGRRCNRSKFIIFA